MKTDNTLSFQVKRTPPRHNVSPQWSVKAFSARSMISYAEVPTIDAVCKQIKAIITQQTSGDTADE